jgi:hypothetical protein
VRLESLGLRLHPGKTKIVYGKGMNGRSSHEHTSFTFLGFEFLLRSAENRNGQLLGDRSRASLTCFRAASPEASTLSFIRGAGIPYAAA